ncbi:MAG: hypothetical protein HY360_08130 [Verrucomicrobia bacterium]|nr:hypothetical protein [Verrucomicrobiota bacterium]
MPKYFQGEMKLPFPKEKLFLEKVNSAALEKLLRKHDGKVSLCVSFRGLDDDCLGYLFNIQQISAKYEVRDITKKLLFPVASRDELVEMIKHASGGNYDPKWQQHFQVLRNRITSEK